MADRRLLFSAREIAERVGRLGEEIQRDYRALLRPGEKLLCVGVLNGAFVFMADLVRALEALPVDLDFIRLSSYQNRTTSSAELIMTKDLEKDVAGRHVLVVEDIVDCGLTLSWLLDLLRRRGASSLKVAVALDKKARRQVPLSPDYAAFSLADGFVVGYGLDYAEDYRHWPDLYELIVD